MAASLSKYDPMHDMPDAPDREEFTSCVLLPMYLSTIFDRDMSLAIYYGLAANRPSALAQLLWVNEHYDNTTGVVAVNAPDTHKGWTIARDAESGLQFVFRPDGTKYGQTQTEAAAKIMRRRAIERSES